MFGECIGFVDADDYIEQNHLKELYNGKTDFSLIQIVKKDGNNISKPHVYSQEIISAKEFIEMELKMQIPFNFVQLMYHSNSEACHRRANYLLDFCVQLPRSLLANKLATVFLLGPW